MLLRRLLPARRVRLGVALALFATLLLPPSVPLSGPGGAAWDAAFAPAIVLAQDNVSDQATLETSQPQVQWSASGSDAWQTVPTRQTASAGDRVRTGAGASARLVYFEGTITEIGENTGLLVQRLERSPDGNIVSRLFQSAGTTVSRVVHLVDPSAAFEIDTPAATAFVRGTTPRVQVADDGTARVGNLPIDGGGTVDVQGKDANATVVTLQQNEETTVRPGQPPSAPSPISSQQGQQQTNQTQDQQQQMMQQQAMAAAAGQAMAGQAIAANMAAQGALANAAAAQQLQNQLLVNQLFSSPNFPFSSFPVATGTVRLR
ncbi:MAG TPA: FecR domain-containing protein [Chloroflexota bacterium]|jgi:hypothetical protein